MSKTIPVAVLYSHQHTAHSRRSDETIPKGSPPLPAPVWASPLTSGCRGEGALWCYCWFLWKRYQIYYVLLSWRWLVVYFGLFFVVDASSYGVVSLSSSNPGVRRCDGDRGVKRPQTSPPPNTPCGSPTSPTNTLHPANQRKAQAYYTYFIMINTNITHPCPPLIPQHFLMTKERRVTL